MNKAPTTTSIWDHVERRPPTMQPVRSVDWSLQDTEFTMTERIRNTLPAADELPPGVEKFRLAEQWAEALRARRGSGFEYAWRDDHDRLVAPTWITITSAVYHPSTGRIVACGHLTHENWGLSPAYDLGAITGSNGMTWAMQGHADGLHYPAHGLYVGSTATSVLTPVDATADVISVDLDPTTGSIAVLESLGPIGCLAVQAVDGTLGRRRLAVLEPWTGSEQVRFSPDGRWLLVSGATRAWLCEVESARILDLPLSNCAWWPCADSTLLEIAHAEGRCVPRLFSLERDEYVRDFPQIVLDEPMLPGLEHAWTPAVSPDGEELLVLMPVGVTPAYRAQHGVGSHLARVHLRTGRARLVHRPLVNENPPWEREVNECRWTRTAHPRAVRLHADMFGRLRRSSLDHEALAAGRYAPEAEAVLVKTINTAIDLTQQNRSMAYLMPEVLTSLIVLREDAALWETVSGSLADLADQTSRLRASGVLAPANASAWRQFADAMRALSGDPTGRVDPLEASWV